MLKSFFPSLNKPDPTTPPSDRQYALACIPMRHPECREESHDEGLLLRYSVQAKPWLQQIFKSAAGRKPEIIQKKLQLDAMGSAVWQMIDGKKSVRQISHDFQKQHQLDPREAEISITAFLQQLGKRSLVALKEPEEEQASGKVKRSE